MNTQAHAIVSFWFLNKRLSPSLILWTAVLPDLPMFFFYGWVKIVEGAQEQDIWQTLYFQDSWQDFFDLFNSIPLAVLIILGGWLFKKSGLMFSGVSILLHLLCDLPLHHDDGHRHFFPFSDFRYSSPVSYWDPKHFGWITAPMEAVLYLGLGWALWKNWGPLGKGLFATGAFFYIAVFFYFYI